MYNLNLFSTTIYAELNLLCVSIIFLIFCITYFYFKSVNKNISLHVIIIGICYVLCLITDTLWVIGEYRGSLSEFLFYFVNSVYFISLAVSSALFLTYCIKRLDESVILAKKLIFIVSIPVLVVIIFSLSAYSNHLLFYMNSSMKYERGSFFAVFPIVYYGFTITSLVYSLCYVFNNKNNLYKRNLALALTLYNVPILIFGFLHTVNHVNFSCFGYLSSLFILFFYEITYMGKLHKSILDEVENENTNQEEMTTVIAALSEDYLELLHLDFDSDKEDVYRINPDLRELIGVDNNCCCYEDRIRNFADKFIIYPDRDNYIRSMDRNLILDNISRGLPYIIRFRSDFNGNLQWYEARIVHHEAHKDKHCALLGLRNCNEKVVDEQQRNAELEELKSYKQLQQQYNIIKILSENYTDLVYLDVDDKTVEVLTFSDDSYKSYINSVLSWDDFLTVSQEFSNKFVYHEDKPLFDILINIEELTEILSTRKKHSVYFRRLVGDIYKYSEMSFVKLEDVDMLPHKIAVGISEVDKEYRERLENERYYSIIKTLSVNYYCIDYVSLNADKIDDEVQQFRTSKTLDKLVPGWNGEKNVHKRLDLLIDYLCYEPDKEQFYQQTRREVILDNIEKNNVYYINVRANIDDEIRYYQIKFVADRDYTGNLIGYVLSIRSTDDEMRREIEMRESVEKLVEIQTQELQEKNNSLIKTNERIVTMLGDVVEGRDHDSGEHILRVKEYTRILASEVMRCCPEYNISENKVNLIAFVSPLHDIGKIAISDSVLLKPGKLNAEEFEIMKTHCVKGCEILEKLSDSWGEDYVNTSIDICRYHHERWDGNGYPEGLKGDEIPICAQIVSVADCFDALTSKRVYKDAFAPDVAFDKILNGECGTFSKKLMRCFENCREAFTGIPTKEENKDQYLSGDLSKEVIIAKILEDVGILLAEDDAISQILSKNILESQGAVVTVASDATELLDYINIADWFDMVFLDMDSEKISGLKLIEKLRDISNPQKASIPIIAMTANRSDEKNNEYLEAGADVCIGKPIEISEITNMLIPMLKVKLHETEEMLQNTMTIAIIDPLTKVKNITAYTDKIADLTAKISQNRNTEFGIVICDVNNLKKENDAYGHDVGDVLIKNCSKIICSVFSKSPVYRIGGDEFAVILEGADYKNRKKLIKQMQIIVERVRGLSSSQMGKADFAMGMSEFNPNTDFTVSDVVKRADAEMYRNKGRNIKDEKHRLMSINRRRNS